MLSSSETNIIITIDNALEKMHKNVSSSFEKNGFIEICDSKLMRRRGKKFPRLNASIFTSENVEGHIQGTSTLSKFLTHVYFQTDTRHDSAQALYDGIFEFFDHYCDHPDYDITHSEHYKTELAKLRVFAEKQFTMKICEGLFRSIRTNSVESKFATRLKWIPKNRNYPSHFSTKCKLVDLSWDEEHISEYVLSKYGNIVFLSK